MNIGWVNENVNLRSCLYQPQTIVLARLCANFALTSPNRCSPITVSVYDLFWRHIPIVPIQEGLFIIYIPIKADKNALELER